VQAIVTDNTSDQLLLTVEQAAHILNVGRTMMYQLIQSEQLFSVKIGKKRLVPGTALEDYVSALVGQEACPSCGVAL
jgi:excisionase family DNA binding protein